MKPLCATGDDEAGAIRVVVSHPPSPRFSSTILSCNCSPRGSRLRFSEDCCSRESAQSDDCDGDEADTDPDVSPPAAPAECASPARCSEPSWFDRSSLGRLSTSIRTRLFKVGRYWKNLAKSSRADKFGKRNSEGDISDSLDGSQDALSVIGKKKAGRSSGSLVLHVESDTSLEHLGRREGADKKGNDGVGENSPRQSCDSLDSYTASGSSSKVVRECKLSGPESGEIVGLCVGGNTIHARRWKGQKTEIEWINPPQTCLIVAKLSKTVGDVVSQAAEWMTSELNMRIYLEKEIWDYLPANARNNLQAKEVYIWPKTENGHELTDFIVTLGGDGTVLWSTQLFPGPVPPLLPFNLGSLGFMANFEIEHFKEEIENFLKGRSHVSLRHRLLCRILRGSSSDQDAESVSASSGFADEDKVALNEVVIDRGISPFISNLECYCNNIFVTKIQGDGLIVSTPTGSTAYSLAAGGSMIHPQVPGILFTPICPHSLSSRPLVFPDNIVLKIQIPSSSRASAWASFDGKGRVELQPGDAVFLEMSDNPVPTVSKEDPTKDWFHAVRDGLLWNSRLEQGKGHVADGESSERLKI